MISMRGLKVPDMTLSRCVICTIWPKLASEVVEDFGYCDDDEFHPRAPGPSKKSATQPYHHG